jgi:hypothetical protein
LEKADEAAGTLPPEKLYFAEETSATKMVPISSSPSLALNNSVENDAETSRERRNRPKKKNRRKQKSRSSLLTQLGQKNKALF